MSGFSPEWLTLREGADNRARNSEIASAVEAHFALRSSVRVVDLGCGTGSNLRATSQLLPNDQHWTLVDLDTELLASARMLLRRWADRSEEDGETLVLHRGAQTIAVSFVAANLAHDVDKVIPVGADLVTASALFDLTSETFIRELARLAAARRAAFYTALTYNGRQRWNPHRPADNEVQSAFHRHQMSDKGFGPAAGPIAPSHLADHFRLFGYVVLEGDSPWVLGRNDRMLIDEMVRGHAFAAAETGVVDIKTIEAWVKVQRTGAETGHTDTFAVPSGEPLTF